MKKQLAFSILVAVLQTTMASAQYMSPDTNRSSAVFFRLYPLELIIRELRMGLEIPTAPRQAIVLDGSYFWADNSTQMFANKQGWAIKMDYRFYQANRNERSRFFWGPNFMVKQQTYVTGNTSMYTFNPTLDSRMVYCVNVKAGADFRLSRTSHSRIEFFSGLGVRYKSKGINHDYNIFSDNPGGSGSTVSGSKIWPNFLLGLVLKL